jgi:hypothetical protein
MKPRRLIGLLLGLICSMSLPANADQATARRILSGETDGTALRYSLQKQTICGFLEGSGVSVGCVTDSLFTQKQGPPVHAYLYDGAGTGGVISVYLAYRAQLLKIAGQNMRAVGLRDGAVQIRSNPWLSDPSQPSHSDEISTAIETHAVLHDRLIRTQPLHDLYRAAVACRFSDSRLESQRMQPGFIKNSESNLQPSAFLPSLGGPDLVEMIGLDPRVGYSLRSMRRLNITEVRYVPPQGSRVRSDSLYFTARNPTIVALQPLESSLLRGESSPIVSFGDSEARIRKAFRVSPAESHLCGATQLYYGVSTDRRVTVIVTTTRGAASSFEVYGL